MLLIRSTLIRRKDNKNKKSKEKKKSKKELKDKKLCEYFWKPKWHRMRN